MFDFSDVPTPDTADWLTDEQHGDIRRSLLQTPHDSVKLYHPKLRALKYGAGTILGTGSDSNITFGDVEPHFAIVRADNPYLDPTEGANIWRSNRHLVLVEVGQDVKSAQRKEAVVEDDEEEPGVATPAPRRTVTTGTRARK